MGQRLYVIAADELVKFLEKEITEGRNPTTPEEWEACMVRMVKEKKVRIVAETKKNFSAGYLAGSLRDEGINARVLKPPKKNKEDK